MKINRLYVENFKGFARAEWHLGSGFNVFIGDNGSGKTAVLDALAVALDPVVYKSTVAASRAIRPDEVRIDRYEKQFDVVVGASGTYDGEAVSWRRTLSGKSFAKTSSRETKALRKHVDALFGRIRSNEPVTAPVVSYFTTGRLWQQKREKLEATISPASKLRAYDYCLDAEANDSFLFRWFKTMQLAEMQTVLQPGVAHEPLVEAIRFAICGCMEGDRKYLSFNILMNEVVAASEAANDAIPFRMLSDGQRTVAAMILDIGYRCITLNPHLGLSALAETPGIVLIDELDLHLHPRWQRRIVNDLRQTFPRIQFIATTHSPLIIQSLLPGELIDLTGGDHTGYDQQSVEEILSDEMGVTEVRRNKEYQEMVSTAEEYYRLLESEESLDGARLTYLQDRLNELTLPYHSNPAYPAYRNFLEQRLIIASGNCE